MSRKSQVCSRLFYLMSHAMGSQAWCLDNLAYTRWLYTGRGGRLECFRIPAVYFPSGQAGVGQVCCTSRGMNHPSGQHTGRMCLPEPVWRRQQLLTRSRLKLPLATCRRNGIASLGFENSCAVACSLCCLLGRPLQGCATEEVLTSLALWRFSPDAIPRGLD